MSSNGQEVWRRAALYRERMDGIASLRYEEQGRRTMFDHIQPMPQEKALSRNLIADYYDRLRLVIRKCGADVSIGGENGLFCPGFVLPQLDAETRRFFDVARASWASLGSYKGVELELLDLTKNPNTNTTKTFASLLMVGRAIEYIRRTGEKILILTPTSGNKGTAIRDAVERALAGGLVEPNQLRVVTITPVISRAKLRDSTLASNRELRRLNPVLLYDGIDWTSVKELGHAFASEHGAMLRRDRGINIWFTPDLRNYTLADAVRAFFEHDVSQPRDLNSRVHAHAVSSAYGLLGYSLGREVLEELRLSQRKDRPGYLMIQHLGAPDMVLNLYHGSFSRDRVPPYRLNTASGRYEQLDDVHFPSSTYDPNEILDSTLYAREPQTSREMNRLIAEFGGGGIVVSLAECLDRYAQVRMLLKGVEQDIPSDPRMVLEWATIMAIVGVANAIDRKLFAHRSVVIHGTGLYTTQQVTPMDSSAIRVVRSASDIARCILDRDF